MNCEPPQRILRDAKCYAIPDRVKKEIPGIAAEEILLA